MHNVEYFDMLNQWEAGLDVRTALAPTSELIILILEYRMLMWSIRVWLGW